MFYQFNQNNSGGSFDFDKKRGITHWVIVEADSPQDANDRAESIGLYWDGCDSGIDCPCCGDRWYPLWRNDGGDDAPKVYSQPVEEAEGYPWMEEGKEIAVHYADGTFKFFGMKRAE